MSFSPFQRHLPVSSLPTLSLLLLRPPFCTPPAHVKCKHSALVHAYANMSHSCTLWCLYNGTNKLHNLAERLCNWFGECFRVLQPLSKPPLCLLCIQLRAISQWSTAGPVLVEIGRKAVTSSIMCIKVHVHVHVHVTPAQLMRPGIC